MSVTSLSSVWCWFTVALVCLSRGVFTQRRESGRVVHLVNHMVPSFLYFNTAPGDSSSTRRQDNSEIIQLILYPSRPTVLVRRGSVLLTGEAEGTLSFTQKQPPIGEVKIEGVIRNLSPGLHGIHIHELGDIRAGCGATGSHYNPYNRSHGGPNEIVRHIGDLGNIEADNQGIAYVNLTDTTISLVGPRSVVGRSVVVKAAEDDLGRGDNVDSANTGNAGPAVGCGVIGFA